MRKRICSIHSRWVYLLFFLLVFLAFEMSIKFTFYAKEETLSQTKYRQTDANSQRPAVDVAARIRKEELRTEAKRGLQSVLTGTKRDLLISHEFRSGPSPQGIMKGDIEKGTLASTGSQSPDFLSSLLSPLAFISKIQRLVSAEPVPGRGEHDAKRTISKKAESSASIRASAPSSSVVLPKNSASAIAIEKHRSAAPSTNHSSVHFSPAQNHASPASSVVSPAVVSFTNHSSLNRTSSTPTVVGGGVIASSGPGMQTSSLNSTIALITNSSITPICPESPPNLVGMVKVDKSHKEPKSLEKKHASDVFPGGFYKPSSCLPRHRVAIVVPFRDRAEHLNIFLNHMMPFLKKQQLEFAIYVVELAPKEKFNRAMLMNIGYREALKDREWQCFVFHDVDLLPENDRNIYSCPANPRHMSAAVDTMDYKLPYKTIFGGVSAFSKVHFELINGFSNLFFGWGGEDDDLYYRTVKKGLKVTRYPMKIARYTMLKHVKDKPNPDRFKYLKEGTRRMADDGINKLTYKLIRTERRKLFTKILVSIDEKAVKLGIKVRKRGQRAVGKRGHRA